MRNAPIMKAERFRVRTGDMQSFTGDGNNGCFRIPHGQDTFTVVVSDGEGWEHVSVSLSFRCPTWQEMCFFKDLFFRDDEAVIQFHPAKDRYVNNHPHCLHLWRPTRQDLPLPATDLVGFVDLQGGRA